MVYLAARSRAGSSKVKLALLADLHSNLEAVTACLAHAREQHAERFAFLGDLVGYNADPAAVVDLVREYAARGAWVVMGNHDAAVAGEATGYMNPPAWQAILWTRSQLAEDQVAFLAGLPLTAREGSCFLVHASAARPERWPYLHDSVQVAASMAAVDDAYTFCGHVHEPMLHYLGADGRPQPFAPSAGVPIPVGPHRRWLAIVGSCGQPRDGSPAACYALFDDERVQLTYHRVPYDHDAAARKVLAAGLPEEFVRRLQTGM